MDCTVADGELADEEESEEVGVGVLVGEGGHHRLGRARLRHLAALRGVGGGGDLVERRESRLAERGVVALEEVGERVDGTGAADRVGEVLVDVVAPRPEDGLVAHAARTVAHNATDGAGRSLLDVGARVVAEQLDELGHSAVLTQDLLVAPLMKGK